MSSILTSGNHNLQAVSYCNFLFTWPIGQRDFRFTTFPPIEIVINHMVHWWIVFSVYTQLLIISMNTYAYE
jgi:hypothetical protein